MTKTERCRLCRELHDVNEYPGLLGICHDCYKIVMEWINEKGWTILEADETSRLREENERLLSLLSTLEWNEPLIGESGKIEARGCSFCFSRKETGHSADCLYKEFTRWAQQAQGRVRPNGSSYDLPVL